MKTLKSKPVLKPQAKTSNSKGLRYKSQGRVLDNSLQDLLYKGRDEITSLFLNSEQAQEMAEKAILSGNSFDYRVKGDIRHQTNDHAYDNILDTYRAKIKKLMGNDDSWRASYKALEGQADATITELLVKTAIRLAKEGKV